MIDPDTLAVNNEGQAYKDLVSSKGWTLAKEQIITPTLLDLQSVNNIKRTTPTDMAREVYARQIAVEYVMAMIKEIEGKAEQFQANQSLLDPTIYNNE